MDFDFLSADELRALHADPKSRALCFRSHSKAIQPNDQTALILDQTDEGLLQKTRADFFLAYSADLALSHWAAHQDKIHALVLDLSAHVLAFDKPIARVAMDHRVTIGIFFAELLRVPSHEQVKRLSKLFLARRICAHAQVPFRVFSGAQNPFEWRTPEELAFFQSWLESMA